MNVKRTCAAGLVLLCAALFSVHSVSAADGDAAGGGGGGPMAVYGNKLYVVSGTSIACIDLKTFKVVAKKDLTLIAKEQAEAEALEKRKAYLSRYDTDKDGKVTEKEAGKRWRWLKRNDKDKNGQVEPGEMSMYQPRSPAAYGDASLLVTGNAVFMLRSGNVFMFDRASLDFQKSVEVEDKHKPGYNASGGVFRQHSSYKRGNRSNRKPEVKVSTGDGGQAVF